MSKENNCHCTVCQVERDLLDSLSTQTSRIHFQALASNHPILKDFDSPSRVIARLHEHEEIEASNHKAWNGILHALVNSIADRTAEEIGQQLLLVAYTPAIHKAYREICQQFPELSAEDIAQQAAVCFLETVKSPEMRRLNGQLPFALVNRFRQSLYRWAIRENRLSSPLQQGIGDHDEPAASNFEHSVMLDKFLQQMLCEGLLSEGEHKLLLKFKGEGFGARELVGMDTASTTNAVQMRLKRILKRLRRAVEERTTNSTAHTDRGQPEDFLQPKRPFSPGRCAFSKSVEGFSPELSHKVPQSEQDIASIAA